MKDNLYAKRGVSARKTGLRNIIRFVNKSEKEIFFNGAFCQGIKNPFFPNFLKTDKLENFFYFQHSDGVGTKASIAYLYYLETKETKHFANLIQDAWAMNTEDLACIGGIDNFSFTTTISRNKNLINNDILKILINEEAEMVKKMDSLGIKLYSLGGETADMGDVIRTLSVEATCSTFIHQNDFINNKNIREGLVIVGLASAGKTSYETTYNSGIGCNGLTSAKHDLLSKKYLRVNESYDNKLLGQAKNNQERLAYLGKYNLTDPLVGTPLNIAEALLSPTRTYLPVLKVIFNSYHQKITGAIHNTGGGQTKCLNFGKSIHYIKDNLFTFPPLFVALRETTPLREMLEVYNCGHRFELYTDEKTAQEIISIASGFELEAKVIGYTEKSNLKEKNELSIIYNQEKNHFEN